MMTLVCLRQKMTAAELAVSLAAGPLMWLSSGSVYVYKEHHGLVSLQVLYALTAGVAGYVSAVQYKVMGGTNWVSNFGLSYFMPLLVLTCV